MYDAVSLSETTSTFYGQPVRSKELMHGMTKEDVSRLQLEQDEFYRNEAVYLKYPSAFWNRPDGDYLTDEPYVPALRIDYYYDARLDCVWKITLEPDDAT